MFVYGQYSKYGFDCVEEIIEALYIKKIKHVCLIDDNGMSIGSFLEICSKYKMNVSFAYPFRCLVEEVEKEGYLIGSKINSIAKINEVTERILDDFIPQITKEDLEELYHSGAFCFVREKGMFKEMKTNFTIDIEPIAYLNEQSKHIHQKIYHIRSGKTVEEVKKEHDWIKNNSIKVEKVMKEMKEERAKHQNKTKEISIKEHISKKEKLRINQEFRYFEKRNMINYLFSFQEAVKQKIEFEVQGFLKESLLAYKFGLIKEKPEKLFHLRNTTETCIKIEVEEKEGEKLCSLYKKMFGLKHPISTANHTAKQALRKSFQILDIEDKNLIQQVQRKETLEEFENRMRFYLLYDKKVKKAFELAKEFERKKGDYLEVQDNYLLCAKQLRLFVSEGDIIYLDAEKLKFLSIPYIVIEKKEDPSDFIAWG